MNDAPRNDTKLRQYKILSIPFGTGGGEGHNPIRLSCQLILAYGLKQGLVISK